MKIIVCPDIHQEIEPLAFCIQQLKDGEVDKCIFLGDLIDSWSSAEWYYDSLRSPKAVLEKIAEWKEEFGDKFSCLMGNHDWSYSRIRNLHYSEILKATGVSGHQNNHVHEIEALFDKYESIFQLADCVDNVVYSHAGFTKTWLKKYIIYTDFENVRPKNFVKTVYDPMLTDLPALIARLNDDFKTGKMRRWWLDHRSYSPTGNDPDEGPLWVRPEALKNDAAFKLQIVGHTEFAFHLAEKSDTFNGKMYTDKKKTNFVYCIDTPGHDTCLYVTDGVPGKIHKIAHETAFNNYMGTFWA